ncbi:hypothetical protein [Actinopolymorpha sp. B9G3]|uniref:hypothetical protein n=1 Tax=Actinopolymorpha sp. B9G3 TaxID=3158970 RepID=UPI0032D9A7C1
MTEKCPWKKCGLPATENRPYYEEQRGGLFGLRRLPDKTHDMWLCPKHARWHDHPEEEQPEVPPPYFVDGIKVSEVDVEWDYDALYPPHQPAEEDIREMAEDGGKTAIRVRFWRANPHQNGYQSYDLAHCTVIQALEWANKTIAPVPGSSPERDSEHQFAGGTFQLGLFLPGAPDPDQSPDSPGTDQVIWLSGYCPYDPSSRALDGVDDH